MSQGRGKVKVLAFIGYYLPGYKSGGPLRTMLNMIDQLSEDVEFSIVTRDRDLGDTEGYSTVDVGVWSACRSINVYYLPPLFMGFKRLAGIIRQASGSVIYINSFFDPVCSIRVLISYKFFVREKRNIILAPRGEFSPGALRIKGAKKRFFIFISRLLRLHDGVVFQASSSYEKDDILRALKLPANRVKIASDLAAAATNSPRPVASNHSDERLRVIFLSRICAMKNLDYALRIFMQVKRQVVFHIYGPLEDPQYWRECLDLIERLPSNVICEYRGEVDPSEVRRIFSEYDLFFFPTRGENYGHVIAESLSAGTPVLISTNTPWREMSILGVGWDYDLARDDLYLQALEGYEVLVGDKDLARRISVQTKALNRTQSKIDLNANRLLFIDAGERDAYEFR